MAMTRKTPYCRIKIVCHKLCKHKCRVTHESSNQNPDIVCKNIIHLTHYLLLSGGNTNPTLVMEL